MGNEPPVNKEMSKIKKRNPEKTYKKSLYTNRMIWMSGFISITIVTLIMTMNISTTFANTVGKIPLVGQVLEVLSTNRDDESVQKNTLKVKVMEKNTTENELNNKYIQEARRQYTHFETHLMTLKKSGDLALTSHYKVLQNTQNLYVLQHYTAATSATVSPQLTYDVVDPKAKIMLTLPILFRDDHYIDIISNHIKKQMINDMKQATNEKTYYIAAASQYGEHDAENFKKIKPNQQFYINGQKQLVIVFDENVVAPRFMGNVKFPIPTKILQQNLVSNEYIE
ncbi:RsiV family protein [Kurthia sibirica]|uniref:DUF3298 domain-containing protein n=1 Tax=Kurthia sibirica TaxID=202750 RepID=A0A2U3AN46_9BACL|nr:RsiV family protein [Kurthia sibirica]PWI25970.1 hypothetical protein DEX24_05415 [Kurthia sibirica]GEK34997.1 hypothetical protein KSI01_25300 [Kurthia sibirica]